MGKKLTELFIIDDLESTDRILIEQSDSTRVVTINQLDKRYIQTLPEMNLYATKVELDTKASISHEHLNLATKEELNTKANEIHSHDIYAIKDNTYNKSEIDNKFKEVFQSVNNGKDMLETTIIDKGGCVSKGGEIASFSELNEAISTLPKWDVKPEHIFPFDDLEIQFTNQPLNSEYYKMAVKSIRPNIDEIFTSCDLFGSNDEVFIYFYNGMNETLHTKIFKLYKDNGELKIYPHVVHCDYNALYMEKDTLRPSEYVIRQFQDQNGIKMNTYFYVDFNRINWETEGETNLDEILTSDNRYINYFGELTVTDNYIYTCVRDNRPNFPIVMRKYSFDDQDGIEYDFNDLNSYQVAELVTTVKVLPHHDDPNIIYLIHRCLTEPDSFSFETRLTTIRLKDGGKWEIMEDYSIDNSFNGPYSDFVYKAHYYDEVDYTYYILLTGKSCNKVYILRPYQSITTTKTFDNWYTGVTYLGDPFIYSIIPINNGRNFLLQTGNVVHFCDNQFLSNYNIEVPYMKEYIPVSVINNNIILNVGGGISWVYDITESPFFEYKSKVTYTTAFCSNKINQPMSLSQSTPIFKIGDEEDLVGLVYIDGQYYVGLMKPYSDIKGVTLVKNNL